MIQKAEVKDSSLLASMAVNMWQNSSVLKLEEEFKEIIGNNNAVIFIKYVDDKPIGFAQCQLRFDYVEGTQTSPVGYLEGIFICKPYRNNGYAKELLKACEKWAKDKNCSEFASDCEFDNLNSYKFHMATGFTEANRIICFKKDL